MKIKNKINELSNHIMNNLNEYHIDYYGENLKIKKMKEISSIIDWIKDFNYKYFVTITFKKDQSLRKSNDQLCTIIKMIRKEYFKNNNRSEYFEGFVFTENQASGNVHYHILFIDHPVFKAKRNNNIDFESIVKEKCGQIRNAITLNDGIEYSGKNTIDPENGVDVQEVYHTDVVEYCMKEYGLFSGNSDNIGILSYEGFKFAINYNS